MLENIKAALGITSSVFDDEISANILVALADMGCTTDITNLDDTDALITKAVMTYCAYQHYLMHGNVDRSDKFKTSYEEQKKALLMSSTYTTFGED